MARRKDGVFEVLASAPWQVGIVAGIAAFLVIRYGIGMYFLASGNKYLHGLGQGAFGGSLTWTAWMALVLCWAAALASWIGHKQRAALLDNSTTLKHIRDLSWPRFELLVGEAFRRQGYSVEETGLGGADGGIDLRLHRDGRREIVQCKQWRTERVGVTVMREMFGLLIHHGVDAVKVVTVGQFTAEAKAFARDKPIELIDGEALLRLVDGLRVDGRSAHERAVSPEPSAAKCARCGSETVLRTNRRNGERFLGCSTYPACKATSAVGVRR